MSGWRKRQIAETPIDQIAVRNYVEQQMFIVAPLPVDQHHFPYGFSIQVRSPGRSTNWLRITPEQFRKIEDVLRGL